MKNLILATLFTLGLISCSDEFTVKPIGFFQSGPQEVTVISPIDGPGVIGYYYQRDSVSSVSGEMFTFTDIEIIKRFDVIAEDPFVLDSPRLILGDSISCTVKYPGALGGITEVIIIE